MNIANLVSRRYFTYITAMGLIIAGLHNIIPQRTTKYSVDQFERAYCQSTDCSLENYSDVVWIASHNSYSGNVDIKTLLDHVSVLEIDFHDNGGMFRVGHNYPGDRVFRHNGNPDSLELDEWLRLISEWSLETPGHYPITVFLELKDNLTDNEYLTPEYLNEYIADCFQEGQIYTPKEGDFGKIEDLKDRIIIVITGYSRNNNDVASSKNALAEIDDPCFFVSVRPGQDYFDSIFFNLKKIDQSYGAINRLFMRKFPGFDEIYPNINILALDFRN